jgi:prolyl-tRNA synthetase
LRTTEFFWQEGHTVHETAEEAKQETARMLEIYRKFCEETLAIPVLCGQKTDKEKFAGAEATYTIEAMMHDGKALQSGTSHYFGDGFSKAFNVTFAGRDNTPGYPHQTSWGMSTRIIGAIIMTHGDDSGLVLPPAVAPVQIAVIPVASHKAGVTEKAAEAAALLAETFRVKLDSSDNSPGWKFAQYEMQGVPLRVEIGPRDIENGGCVIVRRDNREKTFVTFEQLSEKAGELLKAVQNGLYERALQNRREKTVDAKTLDKIIAVSAEKNGFIRAMWCGEEACENTLKEKAGITSRCMPFEQESIGETCVCCGKKAKAMVVWGKAY